MNKFSHAEMGRQIAVFLENRPGSLGEVIDVLGEHGVNMLALALSEGIDIGYLRIIVDDCDKARTVLEKSGHLVIIKDVVLLHVANAPGGLACAIDTWAKAGVNVEYAYSATGPSSDQSLIVARVNDPAKALAALGKK